MAKRTTTAGRVVRVAGLAALLGATACALGSVAFHDAGHLSPATPPQDVIVVAAETIGTAIAAWLAGGVLITLAAHLAGRRLRIRILPRFMRHLVAALLGASVALGAAVPANAANLVQASVIDPGWTADAPKSAPAQPKPAAKKPAPAVVTRVVVHRGDTLWDIARTSLTHQGHRPSVREVAREWPRWFAANRTTIGSDPDHIVTGMTLTPPKP